jgi:hypothetical protein
MSDTKVVAVAFHWELLDLPPYCLELPALGYHFFGQLKQQSGGLWFVINKE